MVKTVMEVVYFVFGVAAILLTLKFMVRWLRRW